MQEELLVSYLSRGHFMDDGLSNLSRIVTSGLSAVQAAALISWVLATGHSSKTSIPHQRDLEKWRRLYSFHEA